MVWPFSKKNASNILGDLITKLNNKELLSLTIDKNETGDIRIDTEEHTEENMVIAHVDINISSLQSINDDEFEKLFKNIKTLKLERIDENYFEKYLSTNKFGNKLNIILKNIEKLTTYSLTSTSLNNLFKNCINLKDLTITNQKNDDFISYFQSITMLQILTINYCELKKITEICNFTQLEFLDLNNNSIEIIPDDISKLINLQGLYLGYNNVSEIGVLNIQNLRYLSLNNNNLKDITNICNLTTLENLYLGSNTISEIPDDISNLTQLKNLNLTNNKLKDITNICNLTTLENLYLESNTISEIPDDISKLIELSNLNLKNNNNIVIIPKSILQLEKLKNLDLSENRNIDINYLIQETISQINKRNIKLSITLNDIEDIDIDAATRTELLKNKNIDLKYENNKTRKTRKELAHKQDLEFLHEYQKKNYEEELKKEQQYNMSLDEKNKNYEKYKEEYEELRKWNVYNPKYEAKTRYELQKMKQKKKDDVTKDLMSGPKRGGKSKKNTKKRRKNKKRKSRKNMRSTS
jgi:Leucine-rich repeat (LRR) protein